MRANILYLSTFGPTLSIISEHWPVLTSEVDPKTGQPRTLRPETALDLARELGLLHGSDDEKELAFFAREVAKVHAYWSGRE